jgi:glycosyltransferase involved in cell wall biosynthesis
VQPDAISNQPTLSICIITYNRAEYLRHALSGLSWLKEAPFSWEVVVFDNCSNDQTREVISQAAFQFGEQLRYAVQAHTISPENNAVAAFRMARGKFVVYLADDDGLIPEAVARIVAYMDANPGIAACQAPWEFWNNETSSSEGLFYRIEEITRFTKKDLAILFDFIIQRHVFPEIGIYRADILHKIFYQPKRAYWAYVFMVRALEFGEVAFLPYPFYRSITTHWKGEARQQHGHRQAVSEWDAYRGGIEFLLQRMLSGTVPDEATQARARLAVNRFMGSRMKVALRLLMAKADYLAAYDTLVRLRAWNYIKSEDLQRYRSVLPVRAAAAAIVHTVDAITTVEALALYAVSQSEKLIELVRRLKPELTFVELRTSELQGADKNGVLVIAGDEQAREALLDAGFEPGLVIVARELVDQFRV